MVPTMSISMPNAAFKFTSIDEVVEKRCNEDFLIDFIGFIVGVCQETDIGSHGERMKVITLEVVLDGKKKIQCNVIGRSCEVFDLSMLRKYQRPPVVVLKPFKIKVLGASVGDGFVDWRAVWSIDQLKKNCEDGIFYVLGTVTEVVDDPN
ncbi:hypothetical protein Ahy_A01g002459 [Arachis hypogaea]|uniref:DUF223 domain-containing protein n=1 Tax=Arachis hypogaea TaxID=3818 RepID=A0A445EQQ8_ARAHY|nr:hypothetical protein Ahy_A01g002459 [Arachis hypogaea]